MNRRSFLTTAGAAVAAATVSHARSRQAPPPPLRPRFRSGLVAYSYRQALQSKAMTYEDLIRIAVDTGTDGIDMTVYWLPNTSDDYLLSLRRLAYRNRVEIYSIGTRVRLAQPTAELRQQQLDELKKWLDVAQRVGATHVRVFGGDKPAGATLDQAIGFAAEMLKRGAELAGARGLILGVEDDGGITFRPPAVYDQIEMSIPYAVSTHVKTSIALDDGKTRGPMDLDRVFRMFAAHGFRGYMGLEYEAEGDPASEVPRYLVRLKELAMKYSN